MDDCIPDYRRLRKTRNIYPTPEAIRKKNLKTSFVDVIPELEVITIALDSIQLKLADITNKKFKNKPSPKSF